MRHRFAAAAALVVLVAVSGAAVHQSRRSATAEMAAAATAFLNALSPEQSSRARFAMDTPERTRWHFIPPEVFPRAGVVLTELDGRQRAAAHTLLKAGLSQLGYETATAIMALEQVLRELEQGGQFARDSTAYYITVFGTPSATGTWAWRFEGHHLSLHYTVVDGSVTVSTPSFLGASPAEVRAGPHQGRRALGPAEDAAYALLRSLNEAQRAQAVISDTAPADILTGTIVPAEPLRPAGLLASRMTPAQQALLRQLIDAHASLMTADIAAARWRRIEAAGVETIGFAWAGAAERGRPHYYRVQGPSFLIEYDNTQSNANHVHTVWRDFDGDFSVDLLREHLHSVRH
jgi:hypothetical protein